MSNAQWTNFPLTGTTNTYDWESCRTNWLQLIAATREKCTWFLSETNFVVTDTYTVPFGFTNAVIVVTNADGPTGHSFTNTILIYTNLPMTNLTKVTYIDHNGSTRTGYPFVTQSEMAALDAKIDELIPLFVMTNLAVDGDYNDWFAEGSTNHPSDFPMCNKAALFDNLGIGYVTNRLTNEWGFVTNGDAYYTRYPLMTNEWLIFETAYCSNGWSTNVIQNKGLKMYDTTPPKAIYHLGGTNSLTAISFTINGYAIVASNQSLTNVSESVSISTATTTLTEVWHNITNITTASPGMNTGDVLSIVYNNPHAVYGDMPYQIYAKDFDERWKVLNALRWTRASASWARENNGMIQEGYSVSNDPPYPWTYTSFEIAKNEAEGGGYDPYTYTNTSYVFGYGNVVQGHYWLFGWDGSSYLWKWFWARKSWNTNQIVRSTDGYTNAIINYDGRSNFIAKGYVYSRAVAFTDYGTNTVFDLQGDDAYFEANKLVSQNTNWLVNGTTNDVEIGHGQYFEWTDTANWMAESDLTTNSSAFEDYLPTDYYHDRYYKGYNIDLNLFLYKWDEYTNGIVWK